MRTALMIILMAYCFVGLPQNKKNRRIPKGIEPNKSVRFNIEKEIQYIRLEVDKWGNDQGEKTNNNWWNDVIVIAEGVERVLVNQEFKDTKQIEAAFQLLDIAKERLSQLKDGKNPWQWPSSGFSIRGYKSRIDESHQPYGLEIPTSVRSKLIDEQFPSGEKLPLEVWLHGRDDSLHEVKFMNRRLSSSSPFPSHEAIVLHPYGRYCNAYKFAGEVDVLEAIREVMEDYPIDPDKIILRGFSMGGGGVWHLATHYADMFAFASPGAGFSETYDYLGLKNKPERPDYERTLWNWYDATTYASNLANLPITAYSGEIDKQIQAARIMESALEMEGMVLDHVIGKGMGHKYNKESINSISSRAQAILSLNRRPSPTRIEFSTSTLRYSKMHWFRATGLKKHWEKAKGSGHLIAEKSRIDLKLKNITSFNLEFKTGEWLGPMNKPVRVVINGREQTTYPPKTDRSWSARFELIGSSGDWMLKKPGTRTVKKRFKKPGMQGPIDDAFLSRFIAVPPDGNGFKPAHDTFALREFKTLKEEWRHQFRGNIIEKQPHEITDEDITSSNLILFGDPKNNKVIEKILSGLPIDWGRETIVFRENNFPTETSTVQMIFPNPLNPEKYVVLNSAFTFHSTISSSNADQTPKLPDYAVINFDDSTSTKVISAGFFDENWE